MDNLKLHIIGFGETSIGSDVGDVVGFGIETGELHGLEVDGLGLQFFEGLGGVGEFIVGFSGHILLGEGVDPIHKAEG